MTQAPPFSPEILLTLLVAVGALALFLWNRFSVDVVGIAVMVTLILLGLVTPQQGISGFANEATITVAAMFILSAGLVRTGGLDIVSRWVERFAGRSELRLLIVAIAIVVPLSAFINNTPVVVVMIPMLLGLTRSAGIAPSRIFMPVSFASQMGGTLTLIGTSTNLLVAGLVLDLGLDRIGLFDITPPALVLTVAGVLYLLTVGRWLTPVRDTHADLIASYELREYLTGLVIEDGSPLVGHNLRESRFGENYNLQVVGIERGGTRIRLPASDTIIDKDDVLVVRGKAQDIARVGDEPHVRIAGTRTEFLADSAAGSERPLRLAELMVPPRSPVVGRTLRRLAFRARYGVPVLAIQRHGEALHEALGDVVLEPGDMLLVQGTADDLNGLHRGGDLALLGALDLPARRREKLRFAVPILIAVVALAAFNVTTILVASLAGVLAMFVTGCLTTDQAYRDIDWSVLVLLGSILPLGLAMQNTGAADFLAFNLLTVARPLGLFGVLAAVYLMTSLLTELISNNAAAVVVTPIAVAIAAGLGVSPLPFVIGVMIAASNSFMTPIGYQTNTFIYGPGGYRFSDFIRVGGPLVFIMVILATIVIPLFFPF
jgi:di/tricarboxylate transporter